MNTFELTQGRDVERVREIFTEIQDAEALLYPTAERPANKRVAASTLYAAAKNGAVESEPEFLVLLGESRAVRSFHRHVVAETARFTLPETRAASSRLMSARHGEGCRIRIERSRAEPDQFFVVVELVNETVEAASPTSLIVCDNEDRCQRFPLPDVRDEIAQIIAEADSDLIRLIGDPTTKVYLR